MLEEKTNGTEAEIDKKIMPLQQKTSEIIVPQIVPHLRNTRRLLTKRDELKNSNVFV